MEGSAYLVKIWDIVVILHIGANTFVPGCMLLKGPLDHVHGPRRSILIRELYAPRPSQRPPLVGLINQAMDDGVMHILWDLNIDGTM